MTVVSASKSSTIPTAGMDADVLTVSTIVKIATLLSTETLLRYPSGGFLETSIAFASTGAIGVADAIVFVWWTLTSHPHFFPGHLEKKCSKFYYLAQIPGPLEKKYSVFNRFAQISRPPGTKWSIFILKSLGFLQNILYS